MLLFAKAMAVAKRSIRDILCLLRGRDKMIQARDELDGA
jgi:hypothetical protein